MLNQAYDAGYQEALEKVGGVFAGLGRMAAKAGRGLRNLVDPPMSALTAAPLRRASAAESAFGPSPGMRAWTKEWAPNPERYAREALEARSAPLPVAAQKAQGSLLSKPSQAVNTGPERDYLAPYRSPTSYGGGGSMNPGPSYGGRGSMNPGPSYGGGGSMNPGPSNAMDPATGLFRRGGE